MNTTIAISMFKTLGALIFVLACFFLLARFLQRFQHGMPSKNKQMEMLESMSVGQRERVMMVKARGKVIMLGVSPGRIYPLHVFEAANDVDSFETSLQEAENP